MEGVIAVVGEETEPAGFETVIGKELKAGLHKVEIALDGMEAVVAGKGPGKETELAEIETVLVVKESWFGVPVGNRGGTGTNLDMVQDRMQGQRAASGRGWGRGRGGGVTFGSRAGGSRDQLREEEEGRR